MLIFGIIIALALFFYFQKKASDRNMERFQKSREKFEELLQRLRKDEDNKTKEENNSDNKI